MLPLYAARARRSVKIVVSFRRGDFANFATVTVRHAFVLLLFDAYYGPL
jgi:hypothetical protein